MRLVILIMGLLLAGAAPAAAADFTLHDIKGKAHRLSDYKGKWVVVNYWATWCPPCLEEIPELIHFHETHKDKNAVVLGVNFEDVDLASLARFVDDNLITYPVLRRDPGVKPLGPVPGLPTTYLVDPRGEVVARQVGMISEAGIEAFIKKMEQPGGHEP